MKNLHLTASCIKDRIARGRIRPQPPFVSSQVMTLPVCILEGECF